MLKDNRDEHEKECEIIGFSGKKEFVKVVSWNPTEITVKVKETCQKCGKVIGMEEITYFRGD